MKKKILCIVLMCCMLLSLMPVQVMAVSQPVKYCGRCASPANFVEYRKYSRHVHDLWYRCTSCGLLQSLALEWHTLEHHEGKVPTCTEYGWNPYVTCDACGYTTYESLNKDPNNHDLVEHEGKAPTCMEYGWDAYQTCTRCDYSTYKKLPVQHDLVHHEGKEWSCTEKGWLPYDTCNLCDYSTYRLVGPHFGELVAPKEPTCTEIGWRQYIKCSRCDSILANYIEYPALGHVPEANKSVVTKPTCTEDGYTTHTCSVCKVTYTADVVKAPGHSYKSVVTEPTCTEDGYTTYTCSVCEYTYTGDNVSKLKHDPEQHEAKAPTCTEKGWNAYETCKREGCDYSTYNENELPIDPDNHDLESHAAQAPTCTEIGWDAYEACTRCDYTTYQELPALKHDYKQTIVKPTCTEDGYTTYTCSVCEYTYTENPVQKLLHQHGEWASNGDDTHTRTCEFDAEHTEKANCHGGTATCKDRAVCDDCKQPYGELDPKNHTNLQHFPAKAATTTSEGNIEYWYCDGCGRYFSDRGATQEIQIADTVIARLKDSSQSAKTGDNSNLTLWIVLLSVSGAAAIGVLIVSRKKKSRK